MRRAVLLLAVLTPAMAQGDDDLARIPQAVLEAKSQPEQETFTIADMRANPDRMSFENVFTYASYRRDLAVPGLDATADWANRTSFDAFAIWSLTNTLRLTASDRINLTVGDGVRFPRQALRNDLREAYLTWETGAETFLEVGRINVRNGVAVGYNPTDFFKTRSAVASASADPSSARDNRLGTVMLRGQYLWNGGSLIAAYAPKLADPTPLEAGAHDGFGPHLDYGNAADRVLVSVDISNIAINPQFLWYHEAGRNRFGFNLSYPVSDSVIAYGEWAGGKAPSTIADVFVYGKRVGTLVPAVPVLPAVTMQRSFQSDAVIGFSWAGADQQTLYLEYQFHQSGMTGRQWNDWFALGAAPQNAALAWYVRGYAAAMQAPISRHRLFLRLNQDDLWVDNVSAGILAFVQPQDGSTMAQAYASYDLNDDWSISAFAGGNFGGARTEWGSLPSSATVSFIVSRYL